MKHLSSTINESVSRTRLYNAIYKEVEKRRLTSHIYHDDYWSGVTDIKTCIEYVIDKLGADVSLSVWCENGGYRTNRTADAQWKEYLFRIYDESTDKTLINGIINCHAAGTVDDPFSSYDMTLIMNK